MINYHVPEICNLPAVFLPLRDCLHSVPLLEDDSVSLHLQDSSHLYAVAPSLTVFEGCCILDQTRFDHFRDPGLNTRKDGHFRDENV